MKELVFATLEQTTHTIRQFTKENADALVAAAQRIATCFASGHKVLLCGNGGSAADAQHIVAEFVNRFTIERPPLAALALTTDPSVMTSISNDYAFEVVFSKQIRALGKKDDIVWGISTSGNSVNVVKALQEAKAMGLFTLGLTGCGGGQMANLCDIALVVDSKVTPRIQEAHITAGHIICDLVDRILFPGSFAVKVANG